jgi:hemoglobin-like flavoprotein
MNPDIVVVVRASWEILTPRAEMIPRALYAQLSANDPAFAALFGAVDATAHHRSLLTTLDKIVAALDDPEALVAMMGVIGRRHAEYGLEPRHLDVFREALVDAITDVLEGDSTLERRHAWMEASTLVLSLMLRAVQVRSPHRTAPY